MMVTFVSQCEKNALKKTRRVLDAFANRIGDNTWQTLITEDGLQTVKKMLRQTASRSTAVSCHWIRSRSRSQFLWVVGNKNKFNSEGVVAVNTTRKNLLNTDVENDWHYLPLIKSLVGLSALFHDWGKASKLFQEKLDPNSKHTFKGDPIRHEWISVLLLSRFIQAKNKQTEQAWLDALVAGEINEAELKSLAHEEQAKPLQQLPNAAKLICWLIVSHHKLPLNKAEISAWLDEPARDMDSVLQRITQQWGYENRVDEKDYQKRLKACFEFPQGFLSQSNHWLKQVKRWSAKLMACLSLVEQAFSDGSYRIVLHHARLCLMLGDHYYSSLTNQDKHSLQKSAGWKSSTSLNANTDKQGQAKQKLDEHLCGVAINAIKTAHLLPAFEKNPPIAEGVQSLRKPSPSSYRWQDKAVAEINHWKQQQGKEDTGFFAVNMASTGCGKTFANAKVMRALSQDGKSLRFILALGLRTLTLQTGDEYRQRIFDAEERKNLAVLIGAKAVAELHHQTKKQDDLSHFEATGSSSEAALLDEYLDYECDIPEEGLATILRQEKDRQLLYAPVLACTIDHIITATETKRGGRYILPCLRLMSSDLVIDEIDDFTGNDLIAIGRLIHLAGMLGRKVMISSATIPPDLAIGYFYAYQAGWQLYCNSRHNVKSEIGCAWIDEFKTQVETIKSVDIDNSRLDYQNRHQVFINKRVNKLIKQLVKRRVDIIDCQQVMEELEYDDDMTKRQGYFELIKLAIVKKHLQHHCIDKKTAKLVSFGVVRVANISPCVALSRYLLQAELADELELKVLPYHSQQALLLRHEQEKHLDAVLKRKEPVGQQPAAFSDPIVRQHLDNSQAKNIIFVLVATPVEEVGRDHDFDWAVIEPSSYRSIIQLAGRVKRHRNEAAISANIAIMQYNWKAFRDGDEGGKKYFNRPGYEDRTQLNTHDITQLIDVESVSKRLDAVPRIQRKDKLDYQNCLVDLEHYSIQQLLNFHQGKGPETLQGYLMGNWYLTALPQKLNTFRHSEPTTKIFNAFSPETGTYYFAEKDKEGYPVNRENILQITRSELTEAEWQNLWLHRDYDELLTEQVSVQETSKKWLSLKYGELSFVHREGQEYEYNDQLGLVKV
ncbi:type I-F CRISPR-associated helicase Cas3f [uncultured Shewanella sp.]|uniref:type I-F CRISPR-associated helicase Cas3f n=1 Tax=uncultured Shewanella sp. TaxID=173975 RepID=UPI002614321C|nr:type I-F CRISPR-associated helicase Cas3f [uncultured Shewanella sp.]